jgi:hypothetical protein
MSQRFLVYPILFLAITQLIPLLGGERRWYAAQISQLSVTLLACCGAIYFSKDFIWVPIAWALFGAFVIAPATLTSVAAGRNCGGLARQHCFRQLAVGLPGDKTDDCTVVMPCAWWRAERRGAGASIDSCSTDAAVDLRRRAPL